MQQIAEWLDNLGMSEYAERFAENKIDVLVLRHLTDQDLKDIGVLLGHRRTMLAAITSLAALPRQHLRAATVEPKPQDSAERLQQAPSPAAATAASIPPPPQGWARCRAAISAESRCVCFLTLQPLGEHLLVMSVPRALKHLAWIVVASQTWLPRCTCAEAKLFAFLGERLH
jgi:hypothetical protein